MLFYYIKNINIICTIKRTQILLLTSNLLSFKMKVTGNLDLETSRYHVITITPQKEKEELNYE